MTNDIVFIGHLYIFFVKSLFISLTIFKLGFLKIIEL